jgi:hypothetical protein
MTWLYGDSSKSALDVNYIDFLRHAIDFAVEVLLAEEQIAAGREQRYRLESEAEEDLVRLEALGAAVALAAVAGGADDDSPVARCAAAMRRSAAAALKSEVSSVNSTLADQVHRIDARAARERERCVKALESLLLRYDLPETRTATQLEGAAAGPYVAKLSGATSYGLETVLELEVPAANPFAHEVRVDRFMDALEIKVPEVGGWLRKQSRIVPHRLGRHRIARLQTSGADMSVELRVGADPHAPGFGIAMTGHRPLVVLSPVVKDGDGKGAPFEPDADDTAKLLQFFERLTGAVAELAKSRRKLLEARVDGEPLASHPRPSLVIERLVAAVAPTVREIAKYSLSPSELVLRRLLAGDRREEVFVSKSELYGKLEALPAARRGLFDALELGPTGEPARDAVPVTTDPIDPAMVVGALHEPAAEDEPEIEVTPAPDGSGLA